MKIFKILVAGLLLGAVVVSMAGCGSSKKTTAQSQTYTVARGNISVDITAAGNLALSTVQDMTFDLFYAKGTVSSVNVTAGDAVTKGEVLASLDSSEWNDQIQVLEDALITAQRNVTTKQRTLDMANRAVATQTRLIATKQESVTTAQRQIIASNLALQQAQIDIQSANNTINKITPIKNLQSQIDNINFSISFINNIISGVFTSIITDNGTYSVNQTTTYWGSLLTSYKVQLALVQQQMESLLTGSSSLTSAEINLQIQQAELTIQVKQLALQNAQVAANDAITAIDDANTALANARQDVTFAQQDVTNAQSDLNIANQKAANAQKALDDAQASSPDIKAPFDGFVTKINNAGGDEVLSGAVILQVADPNKFEADILVSEMDISKVQVGSGATVAVDSLTGITLPARVTRIAPTATITSGVVNYSVKVEVVSTLPISQNQTAGFPAASGNMTSQFSQALQAAVKAGRLTQQQADDLLKNGLPSGFTPGQGFAPSGNFTPPAGGFSFSGTPGSQRRSLTSSVAATNIQLRQGMTVTVSVIVASRTNVILVPSVAITTQGGQSYVNVISASGALEKRTVKTGISDYQNTEITSGLTEGEKVNIPLGTTTTTSSSSQNRGGMGIPFIGPGGR